MYCEDCYNETFASCHCCGDRVEIRSYEYHIGPDNDAYCTDCYSELFTVCDSCGETISIEYSFENSHGDILCEDCYYDSEDSGVIHDYMYKPEPVFHKMPNEKYDSLFMGLELEVEKDRSNIPVEETIENNVDSNMFYCKHDGSILNGFEIVSHPFTWEWYKKQFMVFMDMISGLRKDGYRSYSPGTCGIHIHMSRKAFTTLHLYKFIRFFYDEKHEPFIYKISQRDEKSTSGSCQWSGHRDMEKTKKWSAVKIKENELSRYTALNCTKSTIECRIFRGTLNKMSFAKNIEFLVSVYEYTRHESIKNISIEGYLMFLKKSGTEYQNVINFIKAKIEL